jgi:DNA-binding NarL/FixJ family response regulator
MLTTFDLDEYVYEALRAGASGFMLKDTDPPDLIHAVRVVSGGEALLAPAITRRLIEEYTRRPMPGSKPPASLELLTDRELEVMRLIARGMTKRRDRNGAVPELSDRQDACRSDPVEARFPRPRPSRGPGV